MTDSYPPASPGSDSGSGVSGTIDSAKEQAATAKEQASDVAQSAVSSAKDVAGTAKGEVGKVASEAKKQAKDLYAETTSQLTEQAGVQQARVASGLKALSDELAGMADNSDEQGVATELVSQVADRAGSVASWLDSRDPGTLLNDVKGFARSRPGTFIALAAAAGIVAGRLTRSLASEAKDAKVAEAKAEADAPKTSNAAAAPSTTTTPAVPSVSTTPSVPTVPSATTNPNAGPGASPTTVDNPAFDAPDAPAAPFGTTASGVSSTEPETWRP